MSHANKNIRRNSTLLSSNEHCKQSGSSTDHQHSTGSNTSQKLGVLLQGAATCCIRFRQERFELMYHFGRLKHILQQRGSKSMPVLKKSRPPTLPDRTNLHMPRYEQAWVCRKSASMDFCKCEGCVCQGHSMSGIQNQEFQTRVDVTDVPDILYHGTFSWLYASIVGRGLLAGGRHKSRQDIHFVGGDPTGPTSSTNIISGMRSSSNIVLQVDGPQAARDGITFFLSSNGVILTKGIDGALPSKYNTGVIICANRAAVHTGLEHEAPSVKYMERLRALQFTVRPLRRGLTHVPDISLITFSAMHQASTTGMQRRQLSPVQQLTACLPLLCTASLCALYRQYCTLHWYMHRVRPGLQARRKYVTTAPRWSPISGQPHHAQLPKDRSYRSPLMLTSMHIAVLVPSPRPTPLTISHFGGDGLQFLLRGWEK